MSQGQYWTRSAAHDLVRRRPEEEDVESAAAVDAHHHEIRSQPFDSAQQFAVRLPVHNARFDRAAAAAHFGCDGLEPRLRHRFLIAAEVEQSGRLFRRKPFEMM